MSASEAKVARLVDLVHQLDELKAERHRVLTFINEKISAVESELRSIAEASERVARSTTPTKIADRVLDALRANPGCDYETLVKMVYGEDSQKARARLRSQIVFLTKQGRLQPLRGARGRYEVREEAAGEEAQ